MTRPGHASGRPTALPPEVERDLADYLRNDINDISIASKRLKLRTSHDFARMFLWIVW